MLADAVVAGSAGLQTSIVRGYAGARDENKRGVRNPRNQQDLQRTVSPIVAALQYEAPQDG
jgi:hypothetical protein